MAPPTARYIILDSNVWMSERLLKSSMGEALLYALSKTGTRIGLPEIVETEMKNGLRSQAIKAETDLAKKFSFLEQLTGKKIGNYTFDIKQIDVGINARLTELTGIYERLPFTFEHSKAALNKILQGLPPCGENNEQFRDCCIWENALELAIRNSVVLISADKAFYEKREYANGLAKTLAEEIGDKKLDVLIYPDVSSFLKSLKETEAKLDKSAIAKLLEAAVKPMASDYVMPQGFKLGDLFRFDLDGFATPEANVLAISFTAIYDVSDETHSFRDAFMSVAGTATYNREKDNLLQIQTQQWMTALKDYSGRWSSVSSEGKNPFDLR